MKVSHFWIRALPVLALSLAQLGQSHAVTPAWGRFHLVAGGGDPDFRDAAYVDAALNSPTASAVSQDGKWIYVADLANHAIRRIDVAQGCKVETLAGGPLSEACKSPMSLALVSEQNMLVLAAGKKPVLMRLNANGGSPSEWKLDGKEVPCEAVAAHPLRPWVYGLDPLSGSVYFGDLGKNSLVKIGEFVEFKPGPGQAPPAPGQWQLAATDTELYALDRYRGRLWRLLRDQGPLVGNPREDFPLNGTLKAEGLQSWGEASVRGLCAVRVERERPFWEIWVWDESKPAFWVYDPQTLKTREMYLRTAQGNFIKPSDPAPRWPRDTYDITDATYRPALKGPLGIVSDHARGLLYIAESKGNRMLGLQRPEWTAVSLTELDDYYHYQRIPGVKRILLVGDSMVLSDDLGAKDEARIETGFGKKLEFYLNLFSSLKGKNQRYQVLQKSMALGAMGGGVSAYLASLPIPQNGTEFDEAITLLTYMNVNLELLSMIRTKSPDDVPGALVDPAYWGQTTDELRENMGPLRRSFMDWLRKNPKDYEAYLRTDETASRLDTPQSPFAFDLLQKPTYQAWVSKAHQKVVKRCVENMKKRKAGYIQILLPMRNQLAPGENIKGGYSFSDTTQAPWFDAELAKIAKEEGVPFISLTDAMRSLEPNVFPLVGYNTHHYRTQGIEWAALITAWTYIERQL